MGFALVNPDQTSGFMFDFAPALRALGLTPTQIVAYSAEITLTGYDHARGIGHRHFPGPAGDIDNPARQVRTGLQFDQNKDSYVLTRQTDLATRLHRIIALMDSLYTGQRQLDTLAVDQQRDLTDFFHHSDGSLNKEQVAELSGHTALARNNAWNEKQISSIATWKATETTQGVQMALAPQALFICVPGRYAVASATAAAIAWLDAHDRGTAAAENYLNGLNTYATLNEQRSEAPLSDNDAKQVQQFRQLFDGLLATPDDHPTIFSRQPLPVTHAEMAPGQYLIKIDHQVLTLSVKNNGHFSLYHPNVGAMQITRADVGQNRQALESTLRAHINSSTEVTLYKVDLIAAREQFSGLK